MRILGVCSWKRGEDKVFFFFFFSSATDAGEALALEKRVKLW